MYTFFDEEESKHESLVSPVRPRQLVKFRHQLLLGLPVYYENDGSTSGLEQPDHPVVRLGSQFVDLQLGNNLALFVNLEDV